MSVIFSLRNSFNSHHDQVERAWRRYETGIFVKGEDFDAVNWETRTEQYSRSIALMSTGRWIGVLGAVRGYIGKQKRKAMLQSGPEPMEDIFSGPMPDSDDIQPAY